VEQREARLDDLPEDVKKRIMEHLDWDQLVRMEESQGQIPDETKKQIVGYLDWDQLVRMEKSVDGRWAELALKKARERYNAMIEGNARYELLLTRLRELLELSQAVRRRKPGI